MSPTESDLDRVNTFEQFCSRAGISPATGRRLIAAGDGPEVTWLSARRMGIRERHYLEWLNKRTEKAVA